eukprot:scaffold3445_cov80-Skeletonema_marinoi.AAC.6
MHLADTAATAKAVSADEVAIIFSFLTHQDIMRARVCKTWRDAAKKTLVPLCEFRVDSVRSYNAMRAMATALPNLQQLLIRGLGSGDDKYVNGEDPDPDERMALDLDRLIATATVNYTTHDINIISNFAKLRVLHIEDAPLNGSYPVLFSFPLLEILIIKNCEYLKWDLEMLQGLTLLKELDCRRNSRLTGNLNSLGALKDSLEKVRIYDSSSIMGNLMDLADFPRLQYLSLLSTAITGHIRDICEDDFPALERLALPRTAHGGVGYEFQRISDVPIFMHTIHLLLQRIPTLFDKYWLSRAFSWSLSEGSPDWYDGEVDAWGNYHYHPLPPFSLQIVHAGGSRRGWSWCTFYDGPSCEINWFDPEPSSDDEATYFEKLQLQRIEQRIDFYRGYHEPPNQQQYCRLCEG